MALMFYVCVALAGGILATKFEFYITFLAWAGAAILMVAMDHRNGVTVYNTIIHAFLAFLAMALGYLATEVVISRLMAHKTNNHSPS